MRLLDEVAFHQAMVFCNAPAQAEKLATALLASGIPAAFISGAQPQEQRTSTVARMRSFDLRVLVATDLVTHPLTRTAPAPRAAPRAGTHPHTFLTRGPVAAAVARRRLWPRDARAAALAAPRPAHLPAQARGRPCCP